MCGAIYIGNTHNILKKRMDSHFSNILRLLKNGQKSYSFAAHFEEHFIATTSYTDPRKYMSFKVVNKLNPIGVIKTFKKPN